MSNMTDRREYNEELIDTADELESLMNTQDHLVYAETRYVPHRLAQRIAQFRRDQNSMYLSSIRKKVKRINTFKSLT